MDYLSNTDKHTHCIGNSRTKLCIAIQSVRHMTLVFSGIEYNFIINKYNYKNYILHVAWFEYCFAKGYYPIQAAITRWGGHKSHRDQVTRII